MRAYGAAGLVAVWAQENTRDSIFNAMMRKETYATSGSRITLRFAGVGLSRNWNCQDRLAHAMAYQNRFADGVFEQSQSTRSPVFIVFAGKDLIGANLDRLQIVKVVDTTGKSHEKIFNIVASDARMEKMQNGEIPPVGSTVNTAEAAIQTPLAPQIYWRFGKTQLDPSENAFLLCARD